MSRTEMPVPRCAFEDRVVAAFLDGAPDSDAGMLAEHLDTCPACAVALRQSREVEALLAAQTRTDLDDATADRLLAGIGDHRRLAAGPPAPAAPVSRFRRRVVLAAAAVAGLAACAGAWALGRDRTAGGGTPRPERAQVREVRTPHVAAAAAREPTAARAPAGPGPGAATGFVLPASAAGAGSRPGREPVSDEVVLRCLEGDRSLALDRRVITARATVWLAGAGDGAGREERIEAPPADLIEARRAAAAARWLFEEIRRGWLPVDRALLPARRLLASRGPLRRELVAAARAHEDILDRLVRRRSFRGRPDAEATAWIGAVGSLALLPAVGDLSAGQLDACVVEARRTGDTRCLVFLVDLYLRGALRRADIRSAGTEWFRPVMDHEGDAFAEIVRRRATSGPNRARLALGRELLVRLELAETGLLRVRSDPACARGG